MSDLISREDLKTALQSKVDHYNEGLFIRGYNIGIKTAIEMLDNAPTVEYTFEEAFQKTVCENKLYCPARPHGKWLVTEAYPHKVYCSECYKTYAQENWEVWKDGSLPRNYCPNCGADMREETDNE